MTSSMLKASFQALEGSPFRAREDLRYNQSNPKVIDIQRLKADRNAYFMAGLDLVDSRGFIGLGFYVQDYKVHMALDILHSVAPLAESHPDWKLYLEQKMESVKISESHTRRPAVNN